MGFRNRRNHRKTRALIQRLTDEMRTIMTEGIDRLDAALTGVQGDVTGLKAEIARLIAAAGVLQASLDQALADKDQAVADGVAAARAEFDAALEPLVQRAEALDSETPADEPSVDV